MTSLLSGTPLANRMLWSAVYQEETSGSLTITVGRNTLKKSRVNFQHWKRNHDIQHFGRKNGQKYPSLSNNNNNNKCVSRTDTNPPFAFDIAFFRARFHGVSTGGTRTTRTVKKVRTLLIWLFLAVAEIRSLQMVKNSNFFSNFWAHPVQTAWPTWMALCQNVRRSVSYIRDRAWRRSGKQKR